MENIFFIAIFFSFSVHYLIYMQVMGFQSFLQKAIRSDIGQLLQRIYLRQFIFDGKFIIRIDVGHKFSRLK